MNKAQLGVLWGVIVALGVLLLFPPWQFTELQEVRKRSANGWVNELEYVGTAPVGYHFLLGMPPDPREIAIGEVEWQPVTLEDGREISAEMLSNPRFIEAMALSDQVEVLSKIEIPDPITVPENRIFTSPIIDWPRLLVSVLIVLVPGGAAFLSFNRKPTVPQPAAAPRPSRNPGAPAPGA